MPTTLFDPARGQRVPVHVWAHDATEETIRQLVQIASRPYVVSHVAAMADAHVAHGVAVGTVFAADGVVVPRALGGDLGCGVSATRLDLDRAALDRSTLERVIGELGRAIPAGDAVHRGQGLGVPEPLLARDLGTSSLCRTRDRLASRHLGTLGGGNHFLEIDAEPEGDVWLLVHSGSRGLGSAIAAHHLRAAEALDPDPLAALPAARPEGAGYFDDQRWALDFARANREALRDRAIEVLAHALGADVHALDHVDVHHNYVAREVWSDREVFLHRKGAIAAPLGARAVVPGSMGTASYVVEGLGCPLAWGSCSHGAGRVLTRTEARARIRPDALAREMRRIVWPSHIARRLVEEAPAAYRDIARVLEDQAELVRRAVRLSPLAVLKG